MVSFDSPFWHFSLAFYGRPGVAETCLRLQDHSDVDVNVLLLLLWAATSGCRLDAAEITRLDAAVRNWRDDIVRPLRAVRRRLKDPPAECDLAAVESLRRTVKSAELDAERLQQDLLYHLLPLKRNPVNQNPDADISDVARNNVARYASILQADFGGDTVSTLVNELVRFDAERCLSRK